MRVNMDSLVSTSEANQNFSKIARLVDEKGSVVILKNNKPRYVLIEYGALEDEEFSEDKAVEEVTKKIISKHMKAFKALAE